MRRNFQTVSGKGVLRRSPGKLKDDHHWKVVPVLAMLLQ